MPLTAALSSVLIARRMASSLDWPPKIASSALRIMVLTRDRYIWLRICLRSFDRIRFSDDLVFAKVTILPCDIPHCGAVEFLLQRQSPLFRGLISAPQAFYLSVCPTARETVWYRAWFSLD